MNTLILNIENCKYLSEIHRALKSCFGLPDYYGENWDALWDCLDGWFLNDGTVTIEIHGLSSLKTELRNAIEPMLGVFKDVAVNTPNVKFVICS